MNFHPHARGGVRRELLIKNGLTVAGENSVGGRGNHLPLLPLRPRCCTPPPRMVK